MPPTWASVVVARSKEGNVDLRERLASLGIDSTSVDTVRFEGPPDWSRVDHAVRRLGEFDWVAFTSPRGVASFESRLRLAGTVVDGGGPKFAAVGAKTAEALAGLGFEAEYVPESFLTSELAAGLPTTSGKKVLLLRADIGEKGLATSLRERGFVVTDLPVYRTRLVHGMAEAAPITGARIVVFASPSEVKGFRGRLGPEDFQRIAERATASCIGPVTAGAASSAGFRSVVWAEEHTIEGLVEKTRELIVHA